jgi:hypothetical protein
MHSLKKVTDQQLAASYARTRSVWTTAKEVGMCGQSVHERLVKLGLNNHSNVFTEAEKKLLQQRYVLAADAGRLAELAAEMGRTKQFICRQARELGLTDRKRKKAYLSVWKYVDEATARPIFEKFKKSSLGLGKFCKRFGYDDLGFYKCMKGFFPDEWEHVIELKAPRQSWYRYGRAFEYRARDLLRTLGYFVMRSPASKTPIDLIAIKPKVVLMIQCRRSGNLPPTEWNELFDLAASCQSVPLLASCPIRGCQFERLLARKDGSQTRQPKEAFTP